MIKTISRRAGFVDAVLPNRLSYRVKALFRAAYLILYVPRSLKVPTSRNFAIFFVSTRTGR
jgi:hypothetical protein